MRYISGWEALNVPNEQGLSADWHFENFFKPNQNFKMYDNNNAILHNLGIKKRFIPLLKGEYFVASFARAIADLVYLNQTQGLKNCVNDFLDSNDELELFEYLKMINTQKSVESFMRLELTDLYFKDKQNATTASKG